MLELDTAAVLKQLTCRMSIPVCGTSKCLFWAEATSVTVISCSSTQVPRSWAVGSCVPPATSPTDLAAVPSLSRSWCARASACPHTSCRTPSLAASGGGAALRTTAASRPTPGRGGSSCSVLTATLGLTKSAWSPPASASASGPTITNQRPRRSRRGNATRSTAACLKTGARTTRHWWATRTDAPLRHPRTDTKAHSHTRTRYTTHQPTCLLRIGRRCKRNFKESEFIS